MTPNFIHRLTTTLATKIALQFLLKKKIRARCREDQISNQLARRNKAELRKSTTKFLKTINQYSSRQRIGSSATACRGGVVDYILEAEELVTWMKQASKARFF